jgi:hypothetical protein
MSRAITSVARFPARFPSLWKQSVGTACAFHKHTGIVFSGVTAMRLKSPELKPSRDSSMMEKECLKMTDAELLAWAVALAAMMEAK